MPTIEQEKELLIAAAKVMGIEGTAEKYLWPNNEYRYYILVYMPI